MWVASAPPTSSVPSFSSSENQAVTSKSHAAGSPSCASMACSQPSCEASRVLGVLGSRCRLLLLACSCVERLRAELVVGAVVVDVEVVLGDGEAGLDVGKRLSRRAVARDRESRSSWPRLLGFSGSETNGPETFAVRLPPSVALGGEVEGEVDDAALERVVVVEGRLEDVCGSSSLSSSPPQPAIGRKRTARRARREVFSFGSSQRSFSC